MFHDDMDFSIRNCICIQLMFVYTYIDDKLFILIFDDKFHICMIYGI